MSEGSKAVFLSYASQDAEAAKRICDALRAAGVEVWFDQSELRGGDAWDQKIRRQIKECALFMPVISANTNSRPEGYFRLEWKLAVDRSHLLADDHPFLFPIGIGAVTDATARVPDKFRDVQWTRLRLDETPGQLAARVAKLLSAGAAVGGALRPDGSAESGRKAPPTVSSKPAWLRHAWSIFGLAVAVYFVFGGIWRKSQRAEPDDAPAAAVPAKPAAPLSEARQLVAKAGELFLGLDSSRDDFALAEDMLKQAVAKAPADAEVWAAYAYLHERFGARGWDVTNERRELARVAIQRALRLDPTSYEARFAAASLYTGTGERENQEHEKELRALLQERPDDKRVLRALAASLRFLPNRLPEILELYDRAAHLPGGDPLALYNKALALWFAGRVKEANGAVAEALAQESFASARLLQAYFALSVDGDLERAKTLIEQLPSSTLQDDRGCFFAYLVYVSRGEPDQALAALQSISRDWLNDSWFHGPKDLLVGNALSQAGRPDAAVVEWRAALKLVDQRLTANPNNLNLLGTRLLLLGKLGDMAAAHELFPAVKQMLQATKYGELDAVWYPEACMAMGDRTEVLRVISEALKTKRHAVYFPASGLRHDPSWAPLRGDPEFQRLIAEADRLEAADTGGTTVVAPAARSVDAKSAVADKSAPADKSVAVLAFANLSDDKNNEYFSDGISEELLTVLQKIPGLKVSARTSSFSFKGKNATAQEIGAVLGVANLVEGSVRKSGNQVRITASLSRAATGEQLWSESYTRDLQDIFAVQAELAQAIVGELRAKLTGAADAGTRTEIATQVTAAQKGGTTNAGAHELYLQGKFFANQPTIENLGKAAGYFQQAVGADPDFALAWAALGRVAALHAEYLVLTPAELHDQFEQARAATDRSLALNPDLAEGYLARSEILSSHDYNWRGARAAVERGLQLAPSDAILVSNASQIAGGMGELDKAVQLGRQAAELDPVNGETRYWLSWIYSSQGRLEEAEQELQKAADFSPSLLSIHRRLSTLRVLQGRPEEAVREARLEKLEWSRQAALAVACWAAHDRPAADAALARLIKIAPDSASFQIAEAYAFRGDPDSAFTWLERAYATRDPGLGQLRVGPLLKSLRSDPRWEVFVRKVGLSDEQLK